MRYRTTIAGREYDVELGEGGVSIDGTPADVSLEAVGDEAYSLIVDGRSSRLFVEEIGDGRLQIVIDGYRYEAEVLDEHDLLLERFGMQTADAEGAQEVRAPMPGMVRKVHVQEGDEVEVGAPLLVLEAMKMENELRAERPGTVVTVHVQAQDAVEKNQVLLEIEGGE